MECSAHAPVSRSGTQQLHISSNLDLEVMDAQKLRALLIHEREHNDDLTESLNYANAKTSEIAFQHSNEIASMKQNYEIEIINMTDKIGLLSKKYAQLKHKCKQEKSERLSCEERIRESENRQKLILDMSSLYFGESFKSSDQFCTYLKTHSNKEDKVRNKLRKEKKTRCALESRISEMERDSKVQTMKYEAEVEEFKKQISSMKALISQHSSANSTIMELQGQLADKEDTVLSLKSRVVQLETENRAINRKYKELQRLHDQSQLQLKSLELQKHETEKHLETISSAFPVASATSGQLNKAKIKILEHKTRIESLRQDLDRERMEHNARQDEYMCRIRRLEKELAFAGITKIQEGTPRLSADDIIPEDAPRKLRGTLLQIIENNELHYNGKMRAIIKALCGYYKMKQMRKPGQTDDAMNALNVFLGEVSEQILGVKYSIDDLIEDKNILFECLGKIKKNGELLNERKHQLDSLVAADGDKQAVIDNLKKELYAVRKEAVKSENSDSKTSSRIYMRQAKEIEALKTQIREMEYASREMEKSMIDQRTHFMKALEEDIDYSRDMKKR